MVNNITYDAFGNITLQTNAGTNFRFFYTGRELDPETGNYYYRTRFYDSFTGQFINEDTIGFAGGDANLYRYVVNSPVNYIAPFGFRGNPNGPALYDRVIGGGRGMMPGTGRMYVPAGGGTIGVGGYKGVGGGASNTLPTPNSTPSVQPFLG